MFFHLFSHSDYTTSLIRIAADTRDNAGVLLYGIMKANRPDKDQFKKQFQINKKKIFATQSVCGICGRPVDFELKFPNPLSACCDHIIPIAKGGHPFDIENLQLAHLSCNRFKADKITERQAFAGIEEQITNRNLPLHYDWRNYTGG